MSTSTQSRGTKTLPIDEGLNLERLRAVAGTRHKPVPEMARIAAHLEEHDGYVAFSGGKDSTILLDLVRKVDPSTPVVFFDSGLEYPETYTYINDLADQWNLELHVYPCRPDLLSMLASAGTWDHTVPTVHHRDRLRSHLIEEPSAEAHNDFGPGELWGVRADESQMRRGFYGRTLAKEITRSCRGCCSNRTDQIKRHGGISRRTDETLAYGPIWRWTTTQVWEYLAANAIPVNPVYTKLRSLGAPEQAMRVTPMIDAGLVAAGRVTWLRRGWPEITDQLMTVLPRLREFI